MHIHDWFWLDSEPEAWSFMHIFVDVPQKVIYQKVIHLSFAMPCEAQLLWLILLLATLFFFIIIFVCVAAMWLVDHGLHRNIAYCFWNSGETQWQLNALTLLHVSAANVSSGPLRNAVKLLSRFLQTSSLKLYSHNKTEYCRRLIEFRHC